ncbi:hypothetical protein [Vreelandella sulfidaeris]|uniref:hypothetical protein n=1 Tax=Vreelandella sulfidaeris TaxID=115553 RepID=UPI0035F0D369
MVNVLKALISFFVLIPLSTINADVVEKNETLERLYGIYVVSNVERYRGGLTSSEDAFKQVNTLVAVKESEFSFWDGTIYENPIYEMEDHLVSNDEGVVPSSAERFGDFYGYGHERDNIKTLNVYSKESSEFPYIFEVVEDELWMFLDGWFYRLERTSSGDDPLSFNKNVGSCLNNEIRG